MQRLRGGHGAARLVVFVAAVVSLVVVGGLPAVAADTTPPTLVAFSRTSAATVSPGQAVTLAYQATDTGSGVSNVVFHLTDVLGNDRAITGTGGGPTTATATVDSSWTSGTYRLDEIDATDGSGNTAKYIYGSTTFDLDSADFTVTGTSAAVKPAIRGTIDRTGLAKSAWLPVVNGYVVQANWADLQPTQGGPITANNAIDQAIADARARNAQNRGSSAQPPISLKLRVFAGDEAPEWAKNLDGPPVSVKDAGPSGVYQTVGRFWTANFAAAYQDFMTKLAALYDGVPEVRDVVISRCTLTTAEPFLRMTSDQTSVNNLIAAGFTTAADHTCHQQQVDVHNAVWQRTTSSLAFTPYQQINSTGKTKVDETWTETMIDYCRQQLGSRCVLESNSIKDPSVPRGPSYGTMYDKIKATGPPIAYQTASPNNGLTSLCNTLGWAVSQGTGAVELPQVYDNDGVSTPAGMSSYDKALEGALPADTDTPTVPGAFSGSVSGPSSVSLSWNPSSDSGYGVACYLISRAGAFLVTTMNTSFVDTAANTSTPTTYTVAAVDGAGHTSGAASVTVPQSAPSAPSAPQNFSVTGGCSGVLLQWTAPANTGGSSITRYNIYRGGWGSEMFFASTTGTSYNDATGPQYAFNYYRVTAVNGAGIEGPPTADAGGSMSCPPPSTTTTSLTTTTTTTAPPTTTTSTSTTTTTRPPTTTTSTTRPTTTTSTSTTTTTRPTTTTSTSATSTTRPPTTTTSTTRPPTTTTSTTRPPTTTTSTTIKANPPSAPQNPVLTSQCTGALFTWTAPASNGGAPITAYKVYRGGWGAETYLATVTNGTSYNDTTGGTYTWNYYRVTAVNAAGLEGPPSADVGGDKTC
jgi:fibronectin type 3 domain-containing protein